jgi:RNA polymerase sigma factor (sigma-70 family)
VTVLTPQQATLVAEHSKHASRAAWWVKRKYGLPVSIMDELLAVSLEELCIAATKFDPEHGTPFGAYISGLLRFRLVDWLRTHGPRNRYGTERPIMVDLHGEMADTASPLEDVESREWVMSTLGKLPPRERQICFEHFVEGKTMARIGQEHGVTPARISQIIAQAVQRLRKDRDVVSRTAA